MNIFLTRDHKRMDLPPGFLKKKSRGYTLIETLVSIVILAVSVVVVLQVFSGGLRAGKLSENYIRAVQIAKEKMETMLLSLPLTEEVLTGEEDEIYSWTVQVERMIDDKNDTRKGKEIPIGLYSIHVAVAWKEGLRKKQFDIDTMTISPVTEKTETDISQKKPKRLNK